MPTAHARLATIPLAISLLAASGATALAQGDVTVTDAAGQPVTITDASRVVTLGGVTTEIAYALGAQDQVVAVDESSSYPPEALADKPTVGYYRFLAAEPVLAADPTLIIGDDTTGPPDVVTQLGESGATLLLLPSPTDPESARASIHAMGEALGRADQAASVVAALDADLEAATTLAEDASSRPRVLFYFRPPGAPSLVSGSGTAADRMITLAGGEDVFTDFPGYVPLAAEAVVAAAPDVILTTDASLAEAGGIDALLAEPGIAETPAAAAGRVVSMDDLYLLGFGPRTGQALADLVMALHPELAS